MTNTPPSPGNAPEPHWRADPQAPLRTGEGGGPAEGGASPGEWQARLAELEARNQALLAERAALEERLAHYADLYDCAPVGYFNLGRDGTILELNQAAAALLNGERAALPGRRFGDFVHEDSRALFGALLAKSFAGLTKLGCDLRLLPGGPAMTVHVEVFTDTKALECRLAAVDISRHILLEENLREAERFAHAIIDALEAQICVLDEAGKVVAVNQAWRDFYDAAPMDRRAGGADYFLGADYLAACDPAGEPEGGAAAVAAGLRAMYAGQSDAFELDYACSPQAGQRWFRVRARRLPGGRRHIVVAHEDISERRRARQDLELAALVYQAMNEAIIVADADNTIIAVNPAFTRLTGYSAEEAVGQSTSLLKSGRQTPEFYQQMWHELDATGHWQGEIWNRRKNGETYIEWLSISTIHGPDGEVLRRVAMFSDLTEQKRNEALIWRQANYDALTGLPNRSLFHDRLRQEMKAVRREGHALALMLIDLDHFKEVNDTFGHAIGDQLLVETARRIGACIREADTLARLGGDEFTVILPGLTDASHIERVAEHIIEAVVKPYTLGEEIAHVSASVGITLYPADAADVETLMKNADQAMYAAKAQGRNGYSYFTAAMQRAALARQQLGLDLRGALAAGQLEVYYQPIVSLATGRMVKAEALLRWRHPDNGLVESSEFIQLAEELGLINAFGDWVFKEAAQLARHWLETQDGRLQVCVNKSPRQFMECVLKENWIEHLRQIGLPASSINIEVGESLLLDERAEVAHALGQFHEAGIQVTVDDFGAGYTAMSYFKKYRIDCLKIDRSLVRNIAGGGGDLAIVEAVIALAHRLGVKVIAEGVETAAQRELLAAAGCDYAQGYFFARPMPAAELDRRFGRAAAL